MRMRFYFAAALFGLFGFIAGSVPRGVHASTLINLAEQVMGILPVANGGTGLNSTSANFVLIGPTSGSGAPTWRLNTSGSSGMPKPNTQRWEYRVRTGPSTPLTIVGDVDSGDAPGGFAGVAATSTTPDAGQFKTTSTSGTQADIFGNANYVMGRNVSFQTYNKISATANARLWISLSDQTVATMGASDNPAGNYAGFWYCNDASTACQKNGSSFDATTFWCVSKDNSTQTLTDSSVTVDTNWHRFQITFNDSTPNAVFSIDGSAVCTLTTHLPASGALMLRNLSYRTLSATQISLFDAWDATFSDF